MAWNSLPVALRLTPVGHSSVLLSGFKTKLFDRGWAGSATLKGRYIKLVIIIIVHLRYGCFGWNHHQSFLLLSVKRKDYVNCVFSLSRLGISLLFLLQHLQLQWLSTLSYLILSKSPLAYSSVNIAISKADWCKTWDSLTIQSVGRPTTKWWEQWIRLTGKRIHLIVLHWM